MSVCPEASPNGHSQHKHRLEVSGRRVLAARTVAVAFGLMVASGALSAQGLARSASVIVENDYFVFWIPPGRRSDDNYTQGLQLKWESAGVPGALRKLACKPLRSCGTVVEFGQGIYTPTDDDTVPLPRERPYAGWLYGKFNFRAGDTLQFRSIGVTLGVTGPASYAKDAQLAFHRLIPGFRRPLGWDYQLANEVAFALSAERAWYLSTSGSAHGIADLVPSIDLTLGTLRSSMRVGARARIGMALDHPWLAGHLRPLSLFGFGGTRIEAVAQDLFLDGNTFRRSVRVEHRPFVGELEAGLGARARRAVIEYRYVARSQDYRFGPAVHRYGSIALRWLVE